MAVSSVSSGSWSDGQSGNATATSGQHNDSRDSTVAVHRTCNAKVPSSILGRGLVEQRQRRTNVQVPERSKGLVLGTSVFALAGSNPVLYTNAVPTFSTFFMFSNLF